MSVPTDQIERFVYDKLSVPLWVTVGFDQCGY